jgi:hypothetical protein
MYLSIIYLGLNNGEMAIDLLEKGYEERSEWSVYLHIEPLLDPLKGNERFKTLLKKIGIVN